MAASLRWKRTGAGLQESKRRRTGCSKHKATAQVTIPATHANTVVKLYETRIEKTSPLNKPFIVQFFTCLVQF